MGSLLLVVVLSFSATTILIGSIIVFYYSAKNLPVRMETLKKELSLLRAEESDVRDKIDDLRTDISRMVGVINYARYRHA